MWRSAGDSGFGRICVDGKRSSHGFDPHVDRPGSGNFRYLGYESGAPDALDACRGDDRAAWVPGHDSRCDWRREDGYGIDRCASHGSDLSGDNMGNLPDLRRVMRTVVYRGAAVAGRSSGLEGVLTWRMDLVAEG